MSWSALCWVRGRQLLSFFLLLDTTSSKDFITSSVTLDTSWCNVPLKDNCNIATSKILLNMVNQMNLVNSYLQDEDQNPDFYLIMLLQQFMFIFLFTWISLFTFDLNVKKKAKNRVISSPLHCMTSHSIDFSTQTVQQVLNIPWSLKSTVKYNHHAYKIIIRTEARIDQNVQTWLPASAPWFWSWSFSRLLFLPLCWLRPISVINQQNQQILHGQW